MWAAGLQAVARLHQHAGLKTPVEIEAETGHAAADVIFRTLFSLPITDQLAAQVFVQFKIYQRSQPLLYIAAFLKFPRWLPGFFRRDTRAVRALDPTLDYPIDPGADGPDNCGHRPRRFGNKDYDPA